ncbi:MAG: glucose-6-phosphate isomerase [Gammaproteobacteria bacterium]
MFELHAHTLASLHLRDVIPDPIRAQRMQISCGEISLDFSHQRFFPDSLPIFDDFAREQRLPEKMQALVRGGIVNVSENRPALHTALRSPSTEPLYVSGHDIMPDIHASLDKMKGLCERVHQSAIKDVVVFGIGGSYWGSAAVCDALQLSPKHLNVHFLGDMEEEAFDVTVAALEPETTLFIIISKSFTTPETLFNATLAKAWGATNLVAVTANADAAKAFGISADCIFDMWPWVGGRYSVWSAVGLPIALCHGFDAFEAMLQGAHAMDEHTLHAAPTENLPMMAALCTFWNVRYGGATTEAVLPYGFRLSKFVPYVQQLSMESLGKNCTMDGEPLAQSTGPIVWGQTGLHAQHTFNQLLHQGKHRVSVEFILPLENKELVAACLAQSYALTHGDPYNLNPNARLEGNQPHQIIRLKSLSPENLGALMAFYEHKTYFLACLFGINAFDQFGVELAKKLM